MVCIALLLQMSGCDRIRSEAQARELSRQRLEEYAGAEHLDPKTFREIKLTSDHTHSWIFDFESTTAPRHLVRIYVSRKGAVEINRMIE
jgi:hypothetical protein